MTIKGLVNIPDSIAGCASWHHLERGADSMGRGFHDIRSYWEELLAIGVIPSHDRLDSKSY